MALGRSIALFLLLMAAGLASAGSTNLVTGRLTASQIDAAGAVALEAPLRAFTRFHLEPETVLSSPVGQAPDPLFELRATAARVETWEAGPYTRGPRGFIAPPTTPTSQLFTEVSVIGTTNRAEYRFDVFPTTDVPPLASVSSACVQLEPSSKDSHDSVPRVGADSPRFETRVADAIQWSACGLSELTVTGSFVLVLWEWDAEIRSDGQATELRSGRDRTSTAPEPAASSIYPTVSHARQQYIYVEGGTLTVPRMDDTTHWAFLDSPRLSTQGTLRFKDATGQLEQDGVVHPIRASSLNAEGGLGLHGIRSTGQDGNLHADLAGRLDAADTDGQPMALSAAVAAQGGPVLWLLAVGAVGAVAAPALAVPLRRRHAARRRRTDAVLRRLDDAMCRLDFPAAERLSAKLLDWEPHVGEFHHLRGQALRELGQPALALQHHEQARDLLRGFEGLDTELLAENFYAGARAAALQAAAASAAEKDKWQEIVLAWLRQALESKPELLADMERQPDVHGYVDQARMWVATLDRDAPEWLQP